MKFVIDDRLKHRITGVIVIVSILAVFLPAMMKKSNQRFEESLNLTMRLPEKPVMPVVDMPTPKTMFKTVNVAHVDIEPVTEVQKPAIAKAQALTSPVAAESVRAQLEAPKSKIAAIPAKQAALKSTQYAVQLASFSQQQNAEQLVNKLRSKGYKASYNKLAQKNGALYKVVVGQINERDEAVSLQKKLAQAMQLNGFIVKEG